MTTTCPTCQKPKSHRFKLCKACYDEYGRDRQAWPEWLRFLVTDDQRLDREQAEIDRHEITFSDCPTAEVLAYGDNPDPQYASVD